MFFGFFLEEKSFEIGVFCYPYEGMSKFPQYMVLSLFIWLSQPSGVFLRSSYEMKARAQRDNHCRDDLEYPNHNICCLNCPAGTYLKSPCTSAQGRGQCGECDDGTYTEHSNSLPQCFKCTQCRPDQEVVRACTHTHDTECQCKLGRFCAPDQACEVCKKCSRCEKDEEVTRNCTSTANTECKKIHPKSGSASAKAPVIVPLSLFGAVVIVVIAVYAWRHHRKTNSQRNLPQGLKDGQLYSDNHPIEEGRNGEHPRLSCSSLILSRQLVRARSSAQIEDERKELCKSLNSSASNSQHSLTIPASAPQASFMTPWQPDRMEDEQFPKLVPSNGEESLRKCFEYFEELDVDYHKRFFRYLGISDNMIKGKEHLPYEDKIHDLLSIWVEKEGMEASLNDLLKALLDLNQRRTAENVKDNAIHHGHYYCEINER